MTVNSETLLSWDILQLAAECLKTIAHPVRLRMIELLLSGNYTVNELAALCECPQPTASEHLRLMRHKGLIAANRNGREVYYKVSEPQLESILECVRGRFL